PQPARRAASECQRRRRARRPYCARRRQACGGARGGKVVSGGFASAFAEGEGLGAKCLAGLGDTAGATLGMVYVSEPAAAGLQALVRELAAGTGIAEWVGGVGLGICAAGHEVYDRPAASVMTVAVPEDSFRIFGATDDPGTDLPRDHARWI